MAVARPDWKDLDYTEVYRERAERLRRLRSEGAAGWNRAVTYYRSNPTDFVEDWAFTADPRLLALGKDPAIPFLLFQRQRELVGWLHDRMERQEPGVVEKSRDVGASWIEVCFGTWAWLFHPGSVVGFGSYTNKRVDELGNMDSLLEKMRFLIRNLPKELRPIGYSEKRHANLNRIVNPETGATVVGEVGDNCGRGGRSSVYFIDEFAFFEHADRADAALSQNTPCRVYASTVCGMGNLFARKRHSGAYRVFVFDWREDPRKDDAWYAKQKAENEPHILAAEVDRDYHASQERTIIPGAWVRAAKDVGPLVGNWPEFGGGVGGLDVGAGGSGKSVLCCRFGPFVDRTKTWDEADTTNVAVLAYGAAVEAGVGGLNFDEVGIGAGVAAALNRLEVDNPRGPLVAGVNVGVPASDRFWPDGRRSREKFANLKGEIWWTMRTAFQKTFEHVLALKGDGGKIHLLDELVVLDPTDHELEAELSLPTWETTSTMKIRVESKDSLRARGVKSPDHAEALSLTYADPPRFGQSHLEGMY